MKQPIFLAVKLLAIVGSVSEAVRIGVTPVSAEQSITYDSHEADLAIDGEMSTYSWTDSSDNGSTTWLKARLGQVYCIDRVVRYWGSSRDMSYSYSCSQDGCTCNDQHYTGSFLLSVYNESTNLTDNIPFASSGCRLGDTVEVFREDGKSFNIYEIDITASVVQSTSVQIRGENVNSIDYEGLQYFLLIEDKEPTITCTVTAPAPAPDMSFKKEGRSIETVLPDSLYRIVRESSPDGQSHSLALTIDSMYTSGTYILGSWTCEVGDNTTPPTPFKFLYITQPYITFSPPLVQGVARQGTTITMRCNCDSLNELANDRIWNWFIDNASPAGSRISYKGPGSETGYPTNQLVISNLDTHQDTAAYRCLCVVGGNLQFTSNEVQMAVMRPPGVPTDIVLLSATMDSLSLAWKNSDNMSVVLEYQISYKKDSDSSYGAISTGASTTSYTLDGLEPLTYYSIKIAASNNAGSGAYSSVVTFSTSQPSEYRPIILRPEELVYEKEYNVYLVVVRHGADIILPCEVNSYPGSVVEWDLYGRKLETQLTNDLPQNYERSVRTKSQFQTEYVLYIKSSTEANSGIYSCIARNTKGKDTLKFSVRVTEEVDINSVQSLSPLPWLHVLLVTLFSAL